MDFFSAMDINSSALTAERTRMNVISGNLANANSTRSSDGGVYRRRNPVFTAIPLEQHVGPSTAFTGGKEIKKVMVTQIVEDINPPRLHYDPSHPDADEKGYVMLPNVNVIEEMADMISATRAYEANITATQAAKSMALKTLELGR